MGLRLAATATATRHLHPEATTITEHTTSAEEGVSAETPTLVHASLVHALVYALVHALVHTLVRPSPP
jgi:hypothetical protein